MKTMKLFSMAAVALLMAACSNSDDFDVQKPAETAGVYHFEATIAAPDADATMRTVYTEDGATINVKWKVGDQIALVHNGVVDEAEVKTVDDVTGKATIEATFKGSPSDGDDVYLAYPADAVVSATPYDPLPFTPNLTTFNKVRNQDGTLEYIQNNLDFRMGSGKLAVSGSDVTLKESVSIPSLICIWKLTLQDNAATPSDLNATQLTFINNNAIQARATSTGKSEYYLCVVPSFIPDASGIFSFKATVGSGSDTYTFWKMGLSLTAGKYYQSTLKMAKPTDLSSISGTEYTVPNGQVLTGTLANNVNIKIAEGATVILHNVNINGGGNLSGSYAGITCLGDATIILESTNMVKGFDCDYPGIYVPDGKTLTIDGTGSLDASSGVAYNHKFGAGIGGGNKIACGNILIKGGTITATGGEQAAGIGGGYNASCGNIRIEGGTVTATGGNNAPGIGGSANSSESATSCGAITITSDVTKVTATKGSGAERSIGAGTDTGGSGTSCGTITIGGVVYATGISQSPYEYPLPALSLTSPAVGQVIGSDGKNYAAASVPSGVTKVAMIAYVSGSNGLAIALADEGSMNWATAKSTCEGKTAIGGKSWKLPSQAEWKQMFSANGGNEDSYTGLNTAITTAGGTALQEYGFYWSSTPYDVDIVWRVYLAGGGALWFSDNVDVDTRVRACLAF